MPSGIINSFAKKSGKSKQEVEKIWNDTKKELLKNDKYKEWESEPQTQDKFYAVLVSIVKKKLKINEKTFIDFLKRRKL